jgi:hypothetical protein
MNAVATQSSLYRGVDAIRSVSSAKRGDRIAG